MNDKKPRVDACPTRGGSHTAYEIEYRDTRLAGAEWQCLQTRQTKRGEFGAPAAYSTDGANLLLGLLSYEQAMALAWHAKAVAVSQLEFFLEFRVVPHRVVYEAKAWRDDTDAEVIGGAQRREDAPQSEGAK